MSLSPVAPTLLCLDTATRCASVALCRGEAVLAEAEGLVTTHSEGLMAQIDAVLREAGVAARDVTAVVCGLGPGSFTGLRIGLATAKGLCFAAGRPLIGLSSLLPLGLAARAFLDGEGLLPDLLVAAVLDARRTQVFCGLFRGGEPASPEVVCSPEALPAHLRTRVAPDEPLLLVGDGAHLYAEGLLPALGPLARLGPPALSTIHARYLGLAALPRVAAAEFDDVMETVPRYLRDADARLPSPLVP